MKSPTSGNAAPFITALFVLALIGCTKESPSDPLSPNPASEYFMKYTVNGTDVVYTDILAASLSEFPETGLFGITIVGANFEGTDTNNDVGILLMDNKKIGVGTFTQEPIPGHIGSTQAYIGYVSDGIGYASANPIISSVAKARVQITELNDTYVSGVFSGNLVSAEGNYETVTHKFEKGEFRIIISN